MKFRWSRAACAVLAVASLGAALSGCVALVGGSAVMAGMSVADRRTTGTQVEDQGIELRANNRIAEVLGDKADRKSTRLNSSHLVISYAVFCLKKKKTPTSTSRRSLRSTHSRATPRCVPPLHCRTH